MAAQHPGAQWVERLGPGHYEVKGEEFEVGPRFDIEAYLGGGSYGKVALAHDSKEQKYVAVKKIIDAFKGCTHALRVVREIAILRRLKHPNVVRLVDVLEPGKGKIKHLYVVFENGDTDLQKLAKMNMILSIDDIRFIAKQLIDSLAYLHRSMVIHRDLKPANVLIDPKSKRVLLADFGLARVLLPGETKGQVDDGHKAVEETTEAPAEPEVPTLRRAYTEHVVTRWYRAPEVILSRGLYSTTVDSWSAGCIFAELLGMMQPLDSRRPLFPGRSCFPLSPTAKEDCYRDSRDQLNVIFAVIGTPDEEAIQSLDAAEDVVLYLRSLPKIKHSDLNDKYPAAGAAAPECLDLLAKMIRFNAFHRLTMNDALKHPFLASTEGLQAVEEDASEIMLAMDIEHKFDRRTEMIQKLEEILRNEIASLHVRPSPKLSDSPEVEDDEIVPHLTRLHSGDLSDLLREHM